MYRPSKGHLTNLYSGFLIAALSGFGIFSLTTSAESDICLAGGGCGQYDFYLSVLSVLIFLGAFLMFLGFLLQDEKSRIY